ncbi:MAG TPA: hypothetical protein VK615_00040, partial [Candidatus Binatia bacterium]|nr:hypothetical protein [Candidatus Binatia bacterium]
MASQFDASEFIDDDFQSLRKAAHAAAPVGAAGDNKAPSREEVDSKVGEMHNKLAELKRAQQELERERSALEEIRRRQTEFTTGRQEMLEYLTRGVGLLEEAEFAARRDAEQMSGTLTDFREALTKVQSINEESWARDNLTVELSRANTVIENARMEWNSARLKFPVLDGAMKAQPEASPEEAVAPAPFVQPRTYGEMCKMGLALTWPIVLVALAIFIVLLLR